MVLVPLVSLAHVEESPPGPNQVVAWRLLPGHDRLDRLGNSTQRASRSGDRSEEATLARSIAAEAPQADAASTTTPTPAPTVTTASPQPPPTTRAPVTTEAAVQTTHTHKPRPTTTTTAKPKPPPPTTTAPPPPTTAPPPPNRQEGDASYYQSPDPSTCAHRTLKFGTVVRVTNLANGKRTSCTVADRGPYIDGRIIDLSPQSFAELAPLEEGVIRVRLEW